ncbi:MAG: hypothetical protein EOO80_17325 [Oxalobacteraceae bacterium]|nr:MAG: hypothetical protein EOO80_17325 [Oxalobacteraceae bacterium]
MLAEMEEAREKTSGVIPGVDAGIIRDQVRIQAEAANRIVELTPGKNAATSPAPGAQAPASKGELLSIENEAFDAEQNEVKIAWLPDFANAWLTRKAIQAKRNITGMEDRPDRWFQTLMTSLPSALFVLVPAFALMLKLAYLFKRRLYLEHLVVALYSHVFLLISLTLVFVLKALSGWIAPQAAWAGSFSNIGIAVLLAWMPVYLLVMQKRVYEQGWPMTLLKYAVIGFVYIHLLATVVGLMFLVTLTKG